MIINTTDNIKVINFIPIKNLKQLKKLFNILSPNIKYVSISYFVLDFYYKVYYNL